MDIVERLNEMIGKGEYYEPEFIQAKAEIERLRETLKVEIEGSMYAWAERNKFYDEIEQLREALKKIADMSDEWSIHAVVQFGIIARSALKGDD